MCHLKPNTSFIILILFLYLVVVTSSKKWPSRFPKCYRDDPNLNKCIVKATETMIPFLKEGITEFDIPPISPFFVPEVKIEQGNQNDSINFRIILNNITIIGFDTYKFNKFDFDVNSLKFHAELNLGLLQFDTHYKINGKLLSIPLDGAGTLGFKVLTSNGTLDQDAILTKKKVFTYLDLNYPIININIGEVTDSYYNGLFEGNEAIAKASRKVFDDYQRELIDEMIPAVEKVIEEIIYDLQKKIMNKVPFDDLYPIQNTK